MLKVKFLDRKTKQVIFRNYRFKQPYEIEAIAKSQGWIVISMLKDF